MFRVDLLGRAEIEVRTVGQTDTAGELLDSTGARLMSDDDDGPGDNFAITAELDPGVYYVEVRGEAGDYAVNARLGGARDHGDTVEASSLLKLHTDEELAAVRPQVLLATAGRIYPSTDDGDVFRIDVPDDGTQVVLRTSGAVDTYASLVDGSENEIAFDDGDANFRIEQTLGAGIYYVKVRGHDTGAYRILGTMVPPAAGPGAGADAGDDRTALVALYEATGGDNWGNARNWLTDAPLDDWHGVSTDRNGRVVSLSLASNGLTGSLPPEIGLLTRLERLDLHRNWDPGRSRIGLTGQIPPEIGRLSNLKDLNLATNEMVGPVPAELGDLTGLVRLDIGWNDLTGTIPVELTRLTSVTKLDLAQNNLTGPVHPEIATMTSLTDLDLHGNGLSGGIPPELADLALTSLNLGFNNLTGGIPAVLGDITTLDSLFLRHNQLEGPIPAELGNLAGLTNLALNDNLLTDPVPDSFLDLRLFSFRAANNTSVCIPDTEEFAAWVARLTQYDDPPLCTGE